MRNHLAKTVAAAAATLAGVGGFAGSANAQATCTQVVGDPDDGAYFAYLTDQTWSGTVCLEEPVFVGDPSLLVPDPATLTILPGTIVRSAPRRGLPGSVDFNPGGVFVTRGSRIIADGSPTSPIIMTTSAMDNDLDDECDDLDADGFDDSFPGLNPLNPAQACTGGVGCTPQFCDDTPTTAPLAPLDPAGNENVALWGGLALAGWAPTNLGGDEGAAPQVIGRGVTEGTNVPGTPVALAYYGGWEPHDDSGVVRYVSVRHAGDEIAANNELNGVTLAGVGDGTIFEFVEVFTNFDDGFEWFGGTVNGNHLASWYAGDDQFDIDEGFSGVLQYLLAVAPFFEEDSGSDYGQAAAVSPGRLGEWDNINNGNVTVRRDTPDARTDETPWPFGQPSVYNLTAIGHVPDVAPAGLVDTANEGNGIFTTAGYSGQVSNSIILNTAGAGPGNCYQIDNGGDHNAAFEASDFINLHPTINKACITKFTANICSDTNGIGVSNGAVAGDATALLACGDTYAEMLTGSPTAGDNSINVIDPVLAQEDPDFSGKGDTDGKLRSTMQGGVTPYDPRPSAAAAALVGIPPQDSGLDRSATYRGAFEDGAATLWTTPWSAARLGGILAQ
jgi:hypothetical protein